jgi:hypothetical protein
MSTINDHSHHSIYSERISSNRTEALFLALTFLFLWLFIWRLTTGNAGILSIIFACFSILFLFYSINYRTLIIRLTPQALKLAFGIFTWTMPIDNIASCGIDEIPLFYKYGGAGIHFMMIRKRYRVSFNFLEYPRIVIALKRKVGPVRDISFTTRRPDAVLQLLQNPIPSIQPD